MLCFGGVFFCCILFFLFLCLSSFSSFWSLSDSFSYPAQEFTSFSLPYPPHLSVLVSTTDSFPQPPPHFNPFYCPKSSFILSTASCPYSVWFSILVHISTTQICLITSEKTPPIISFSSQASKLFTFSFFIMIFFTHSYSDCVLRMLYLPAMPGLNFSQFFQWAKAWMAWKSYAWAMFTI